MIPNTILQVKQKQYDEAMQQIGKIDSILLLFEDLEDISYDIINKNEYDELISQPLFRIFEVRQIIKNYANKLAR